MKKHIFLSVFSVFFALFGGVGVAHAADLPGCEKPTSISDLDKTFATICQSGPQSVTQNGMDWTAYFNSNREVHGTAFCSTKQTGSAPASSEGQYCWCGIESYTDGTTTFNSNPTAWAYVEKYGNKPSCKKSCSSACGDAIKGKPCDFVNGVGMCYTPTYQVHYSCEAGTTSFTDSNTYSSGATVTTYNGTQCAAPTGYVFGDWSCDNNIGKVSGGATFTMPAGDVTCTAQYQAINYTVSFAKGNGTGTMSSQTNKHIGDTITLPSSTFTAPSGYSFSGWSCDNGIGNKAANAQFTMPAANVTCTAQYQVINYTVSFDKGNGTGTMSSQTNKHIGDTITLPSSTFTAPSGYSFSGWSCDNGIGNKAANEQFTMPAANVTCTAQYQAIDYTVTFDHGPTNSSTTKHVGDSVTLPDSFGPTGYSFGGWSCDNNIGIKAIGETFTMPAANVTCTAVWNAINYTVSFDKGNGTGTMSSQTNKHIGDTITLPANGFTAPSGYTFDGWSCDNGIGDKAANEQFTMPAANVTCTAQWTLGKPKVYTITLKNYNNTSTHDTIYEQYSTGWFSNVIASIPISSAPVPTRDGYTFRGYYTTTQSDATTSISSGTQRITKNGGLPANNTFSASTILYAAWARNCAPGAGCTCSLTVTDNGAVTYSNGAFPGYTLLDSDLIKYNPTCTAINYTVSFAKGTGTGTMSSQTNKHIGDTITLPANGFTAPSGYSFNGWSCDNGIGNKAANEQFTMPAANVTCTAQYQAINYTVSFDKGTGTGTMSSQTNKHIGDTITLPSSTFTAPSGYTFSGWSCNNNIGNKAVGSTFTMPAANVTCTAQYQAINYTVSFDKGNGTGTMSSQTNKHIGDTITLPSSTFTAPSGYSFSGWSCNNNIGNKAVGSTFTMPANNVTCTAIYENNTIATIALTWDGGGTPSSCIYGNTFDVPTPIPRDGYVFTGWRVRQAAQCSLSGLDPSIGTDYDATHMRWKPISSNGYTMASEFGIENSSDLNSGEWAITFSYGTVKGMAKCSAKSGNNNNYTWSNASSNWSATESELTSASGEAKYCWCHATNYTPNGGNQCNVSSSSWVFDLVRGSAGDCAYYCANLCALYVRNGAVFRRAVFGVQ